jgi:hypothetical protein
MYAKVFAQIYDSSIAEDYLVRWVFTDLLVLADKEGIVDMTIAAIARRTNVPQEIVGSAIGKLIQPDESSRSHAEDGRRLVLLDPLRSWGWQIVNYKTYAAIRNEDGRRDYMRNYMQKRRSEKGSVSTGKQPVNTSEPALANVSVSVPAPADVNEELFSPQASSGETHQPQSRKCTAKRARSKQDIDSRFGECKDAIEGYWKSKNSGPMPWGPAEATQLKAFLSDNPKLTIADIAQYLRNRYESVVNHAKRPRAWIADLTDFAGGPLNEYGKPLNIKAAPAVGGKDGGSKPQTKLDITNNSIAAGFGSLRSGTIRPIAEPDDSDSRELSKPGHRRSDSIDLGDAVGAIG